MNKFQYLLTLLVFLHTTGYAFESVESTLIENRPSPQSEAMCRYGQVHTSLFTGQLNLSIPLYSIDDPNFGLDIALRYTSEGFKPRKHSGYVGHDWFLEAGGCVTREVRQIPDECDYRKVEVGGQPFYEKGMLSFVQQHPLDKEKVFNFDSSCFAGCGRYGYNLGTTCQYNVDYMPDIFHFNFCGYHGSFMINNQGEPVILNGDFVKIDLSKLAHENVANTPHLPEPDVTSCITIQTLDGYTYTFGGDITTLEYSEALERGDKLGDKMPPTVSSWYLKRIVAPNGRKMLFYYKSFQQYSHDEKDPLWVFDEFYNMFYTLPPEYEDNWEYKEQACKGYSFTKECILDSIVINDGPGLTIAFNNSVEKYSKRKYINPALNLCRPNYVLNSISVKQKQTILRHITLSYDYRSSSKGDIVYNYSWWRFLSSVHITGIGTYHLTYNHPYVYPLLDRPNPGSGFDDSNEYGFHRNNSLQGMLKEIIYPTGGKQCFTFGKHTYGKKLEFQAYGNNSNVQLVISPETDIISGARIEQVATYSDNNTMVEKKEFHYKTPTGQSSGIYYDWLLIKLANSTKDGFVIQNGLGYSFMTTHIGYSHVTEQTTRYPAQQKAETEYTYYIGPTSYLSSTDANINRKNNQQTTSSSFPILSGAFNYTGEVIHRGELLNVKKYVGSQLKKEHLYIYTNIAPMDILYPQTPAEFQHAALDTIVVYYNSDVSVTRKIYVYPLFLEQEIITDYGLDEEMSHAMTTRILYKYDDKFRLSKTVYYGSDNLLYFDTYTYPDYYAATENSTSYAYGLYKLTKDNRISQPVETLSGYEKNGQKYITAGTLNLYRHEILNMQKSSKGIPLDSIGHIQFPYDTIIPPIEHIDNLLIEKSTFALSLTEPVSNYTPLLCTNNNVNYDSRYRNTCKYRLNRLLQTIAAFPYGKPSRFYKWNTIYPASSSVGNLTTTYTYLPYVGLRSITDPQGITTWYNYDNAGRLNEVYQVIDGKKQVLNAYKYHISTE